MLNLRGYTLALYCILHTVDASRIDLTATSIPNYVLDYAPLVWLHKEDPYMPSDIGQQLGHTTPQVNWKPIHGAPSPLTLNNLDSLNDLGNTSVFLTSIEGIDADPQPAWFRGVTPDENGQTKDAVTSTIIVREHGDNIVDAFYFYFNAYNQGNTVLGMEFGDHIGDWEHNMIRFENGTPKALWYSQHSNGQAFTYDATEKQDKRPLAYSAKGAHAVYATEGNHDHTIPHLNLPAGFLVDTTEKGILWDPVQNAYAYSYDDADGSFHPYDPAYPVSWLRFNGRWGDDALPGGPSLFGQPKYAAGPNGPQFKNLVRENVCPDKPCVVLPVRIWGTSR
ncbi:uncharacterized protein BDW47DRAFT_118180 [Aspergillus candidus]|uniref:Vacuolar protein sorting-associated protein 62 n=1 Tax=Aspergillus candidus TaxID=41067 RepID=A0A2I2F9P1_ASPCN|nr:hypothetical protein BDW47DRAFT_118180 [Aspergillus candidus]PLB37339.1 hypothetical protein BDW47DRAFT_118180 [Aspergillus candidus]